MPEDTATPPSFLPRGSGWRCQTMRRIASAGTGRAGMAMSRSSELLPDGYKWVWLYRLQYGVAMTDANRARLRSGKRLMGRPVPRLVSVAGEDMWAVPADWGLESVVQAVRGLPVPYFACLLDGEPCALAPHPDVFWCLSRGRLAIVPKL